jgi:hypothetical protein
MARSLLLLVFLVLLSTLAIGQTSLAGKVIDEETKKPLDFVSVVLYKNGVQITGTDTDESGNFNFPDIDPGTYDIEAVLLGYNSKRVKDIRVLAGKANRADIKLPNSGGIVLQDFIVTQYKIPLIEQDNTTSGAVITSEQIKNLPTRNINALAATSAGLSSADEGGSITVRGSRSDATNYYLDGIRVRGRLIPETEIEQLQVITGGVEAQYGDVTGGIISITTKGPANKFTGGAEVEASQYLDNYNNNLAGVNLSGPILKNKKGQSLLGYRFSGRYTYRLNDNPSAVPLYQVKGDKLKELEANPIIQVGGSNLVAADFLKQSDVNALKVRPNDASKRYDVTSRIDARLTKAIDLSFTGSISTFEDHFDTNNGGGSWRLLNSQNNPIANDRTYRGIFRLRHRFGGEGNASKTGLIQNASYTLTFSYEKTSGDNSDSQHKLNYFDYGYVGKFNIEWVPTFALKFDPVNQRLTLQHSDYREVLRGFTAGDVNPILSNYNNVLGIKSNEAINSQVGKFILTDFFNDRSLVSRGSFIAPNGFISPIYNTSWGFHTNVGWVYNNASFNNNDLYTFNARVNFDLVPGNSDKGRHNIQAGFWYEQRTDRNYAVAPRGLWDIARQQANSHIQGIADNADSIGVVNTGAQFGNVAIRALTIAQNADNQFYKKIREKLNVPLTQYVNVDGLSPDQLSLDLFSAKELNDQALLSYQGYDYLGNPFNGNFVDFFKARDANGIRTFPVAPNRPIYSSFYVQDKFTFRDIIFRLGVRVDRYDANTKVLKDPYSLYEIMGASEYDERFKSQRPGNIGEDYKVYLNDSQSGVLAYRNENQWYRANGNPVNNPNDIFSGGLVYPRYKDDRVQSNTNFIKSPDYDPAVSFQDYKEQINIMPRLAFSFPISEDANFFAHYDVLVQRPNSNTLATALDYFYFTDNPGTTSNPLNNPNLRPERTIDYEVGFQQRLSASSKLKMSSYYKELRSMIQLRNFFPVAIVNQYTTYDNLDFGTVKGFSFEYELRRTSNLTLNANYTLQFADGTGSDPNSQRGLVNRGNVRTLFPLNFDERHRINMVLDYRFDRVRFTGPRIFGTNILAGTGLNLQGIAVSGRPYTAQLTPQELGGSQTVGSINGARKPWNFTLNLRIDKNIDLGNKMGLNIYCRISNVLNRKNVINVYQATGSPTDDGFIPSAFGQAKLQNIQNSAREVSSYLASYQWTLINPNNFSLPRRIFVGATFDF